MVRAAVAEAVLHFASSGSSADLQAFGGGRHGDNFLWCLGHDESKNIEWMGLRGRIKPPAVITDKASFKKQLCYVSAVMEHSVLCREGPTEGRKFHPLLLLNLARFLGIPSSSPIFFLFPS